MDTDTIGIDYHVVRTMSTHKFLFSVGGIPYSAKFSRRTIFADWRFQKFHGNNFRGPRIPHYIIYINIIIYIYIYIYVTINTVF